MRSRTRIVVMSSAITGCRVVQGFLESAFDEIFVYDGDDDTAPLLATLTGDVSGESFEACSGGGCITLVLDVGFQSDVCRQWLRRIAMVRVMCSPRRSVRIRLGMDAGRLFDNPFFRSRRWHSRCDGISGLRSSLLDWTIVRPRGLSWLSPLLNFQRPTPTPHVKSLTVPLRWTC